MTTAGPSGISRSVTPTLATASGPAAPATRAVAARPEAGGESLDWLNPSFDLLGQDPTFDEYRIPKTSRPRWEEGGVRLQGYLGVTELTDVTRRRDDGSTAARADDDTTMPTVGGGGQWKLAGNRVDWGLEGLLSISGRGNVSALAAGGGGLTVAVNLDLLVVDFYGGPFMSFWLTDRLRFYGAAGPLIVFSNYSQDASIEPFSTNGSGFGTGWYGRLGTELLIGGGTSIGIGPASPTRRSTWTAGWGTSTSRASSTCSPSRAAGSPAGPPMAPPPRDRGPAPPDERLFGTGELARLSAATDDLGWLLGRGYTESAALALVGNRYELESRQREAVARCAASDEDIASRGARRLERGELSGKSLAIDAFNVLNTLELALSGGIVLVARDGCARDLGGVHGNWRRATQTEPALRSIGEHLAGAGVASCHWLIDAPVSNSGRLREEIARVASAGDWAWTAEVVPHADERLVEGDAVVASADRGVLDACAAWYSLALAIVSVPESGARLREL